MNFAEPVAVMVDELLEAFVNPGEGELVGGQHVSVLGDELAEPHLGLQEPLELVGNRLEVPGGDVGVGHLVDLEGAALVFVMWEALARWEQFYYWIAENESPYVARLDTYGLRFLMLFAITTGTTTIGVELVEAVRALVEYEYALRKEIDPLDAEGVTARLERAIVRSLTRGRMSDRELRKSCNASRTGLWFYEAALKNLSKRGWVNSRPIGRKLCHWITPEGQEEVSE